MSFFRRDDVDHNVDRHGIVKIFPTPPQFFATRQIPCMELVFDMIVILGDYFVVEGVGCCWLGWGGGGGGGGLLDRRLPMCGWGGKVKWRRGGY